MKNITKIESLESKFPLFGVENDMLVSKYGDITVGYRLQLPEIFTLVGSDYENINQFWEKAIKVLPAYTILHKQDWYIRDRYDVNFEEERTFLDSAYERHFNERSYLHHECFLYITKSTKTRISQESIGKTLCRRSLVPVESLDESEIELFKDAVSQFQHILSGCNHLSLSSLTREDYIGTEDTNGLIERYLSLGDYSPNILEDIRLGSDEVRIGNKHLLVHTLSDNNDLPLSVSTDKIYDKLSTDQSVCNLSFASPVGLLLDCNHIYNQYIVIEDVDRVKRKFESQVKQLNSLANYSRHNAINRDLVADYLNIAATEGISPIRSHFNVMSWTEDPMELGSIKNKVGTAFASMDCSARHNSIDTATLYWAGIPGNAGDLPSEETFWGFAYLALCFFVSETNYESSLSPFGIKLSDRLSGRPIHLDISDLPMQKGIINNRNKFILGPSGSGKSFFTNHLVRQYYDQGTHVLIVDTGHSYEFLCDLINQQTKGDDGIYFTYTEEHPITFNPFYTDDYIYTNDKIETLVTLLLTLWKESSATVNKIEETMLGRAVTQYLSKIKADRSIYPCFNTFYEFLSSDFRVYLNNLEIKVKEERFDLDDFLTVLHDYYKGGRYDYLLNRSDSLDLLNKRFIIMEIDAIKDSPTLMPIVTLMIIETFINKMHRLKGVRKMIIIEEAWKAISTPKMANFIKYLYKTVRKHFGEAVVVTQDPDDILKSEIVRESIINNSDCMILLDQRAYMNKFDEIQDALGITNKEKDQILSLNMDLPVDRVLKEVWIGLGHGKHSAVYATEVSKEEGFVYGTEQTKKLALQKEVERNHGNLVRSISKIVNQ